MSREFTAAQVGMMKVLAAFSPATEHLRVFLQWLAAAPQREVRLNEILHVPQQHRGTLLPRISIVHVHAQASLAGGHDLAHRPGGDLVTHLVAAESRETDR